MKYWSCTVVAGLRIAWCACANGTSLELVHSAAHCAAGGIAWSHSALGWWERSELAPVGCG
eukprot:7377693-Prymnesium_polylepis.1